MSRKFGLWNQGARHQNVAHPEVSGGWTYHHLCHALDEVCILIGSARASRVYHVMHKSCAECPSEEIIYSLITFENGATAVVSDGLSIGGYCDIFIQGSTGDVRLHDNVVTVTVPGPADSYHRPGNLTPFSKEFAAPPADKMINTVARKFTQAVRGGKNEMLSFEFVADQYRILDAMAESARTGRVVEPKH
jgi:predicted dehydrogenase